MFHVKDRSIQLVKEQNPTKYVSLTVKGLGGKKGTMEKLMKRIWYSCTAVLITDKMYF